MSELDILLDRIGRIKVKRRDFAMACLQVIVERSPIRRKDVFNEACRRLMLDRYYRGYGDDDWFYLRMRGRYVHRICKKPYVAYLEPTAAGVWAASVGSWPEDEKW